ncbi:MAG TPA: type II toxin-antitoxin system VapB family antitoxin [Nakamurella sp.]|nr:type II toxin-antitoxin system VapB family antitoxin [Nakamurella sp.]
MALSIKTAEADRLARELAAATGETLTDAVTKALRERLDRVRSRSRIDIAERLDRLSLEYSAMPVVDDRTPDEIIGYDENGLPS